MAQARKRQMYRTDPYPVISFDRGNPETVVDLNRAERLRQARRAAGFARASDAIAAFGWKQSTYWAHENGRRGISRDQILVYATSFHVAADWLAFGHEGLGETRPRRIVIEGYMIALGKIVRKEDLDLPVTTIEDIEMPPTMVGDWSPYRVSGNGNYPAYRDGDVLFVPRRPARTPEHYINRECLVTMPDGQRLIRTILRGTRVGMFVLIGFNYPPMIDVEISAAAPVEWIKRG